jgi:hypothetical protein
MHGDLLMAMDSGDSAAARDGDSPEARLPVLRQPLPVDVFTLGVNKA